MIIAADSIENLKKNRYLIINDGKNYCWKLDLINNKVDINYGTLHNPLHCNSVIITKSNESNLDLFENKLHEAKIYFMKAIECNYMHRTHASQQLNTSQ